MNFYLNLLIIIILDLVSVLSIRNAYENENLIFLIIGIICLGLAGYFFIKILNHGITVVLNALWIAMSSILVAIAGYLLFDEEISLTQGIGMAIVVIGVIASNYTPKEIKNSS